MERFQSTQPSQAVTMGFDFYYKIMQFQSTQPSQAVTPFALQVYPDLAISIHTALAGCDP